MHNVRIFQSGLSTLLLIAIAISTSPVQARTAMEAIQSEKQLDVCVWAPYTGITSIDSQGVWRGVDIDMATQLASDLGVAANFIESSFGTFSAQLVNGECHVAMFGIGRTFARAKQVAFSAPYMASGLHAVVNSNKNDITAWKDLDVTGNKIAVTKNTFVEVFMGEHLKNATMLPISPPEWTKALQSGRADALVTDFVFATKLKKNNDWASVISPDHDLKLTTYGYAVAPNSQHLLNFVDLFLAESQRNGLLPEFARTYGLESILYP